jgi:hypothetical protein
MGSAEACQGMSTVVKVDQRELSKESFHIDIFKDPSAIITFNESSITRGCTSLNISIIYQVIRFFNLFVFVEMFFGNV